MTGIHVKTVKSEQVWQSDDGERTIWEVTLKATAGGKEYKLKTYSKQIAEEGWTGEVVSYVNPRDERFVRAVPGKPQNGYGRDESAIKAQWAIGQAVALYNLNDESLVLRAGDPATQAIQETATVLFNMVDNVKGEQ